MEKKSPLFRGGVEGNAKFGDSYHIQDRIYDSSSIACTVTTDPYKSPFYLIRGNEYDRKTMQTGSNAD